MNSPMFTSEKGHVQWVDHLVEVSVEGGAATQRSPGALGQGAEISYFSKKAAVYKIDNHYILYNIYIYIYICIVIYI